MPARTPVTSVRIYGSSMVVGILSSILCRSGLLVRLTLEASPDLTYATSPFNTARSTSP